jgi:hypothetical protein
MIRKNLSLKVLLLIIISIVLVGCASGTGTQSATSTDAEIEPMTMETGGIVGTDEAELNGEDPDSNLQTTPTLSLKDVDITFSKKTILPKEVVPMPSYTIVPDPSDPGEMRFVLLAKENLAERLNVSVDNIGLVEFALVTWGDPSLGCPQPGMKYKQVPVDGYLIRLAYEGQVFNYHGGGSRDPFLCETSGVDLDISPPPGSADV